MLTPVFLTTSGTLASGNVGGWHLASGAVISGRLANAAVVSGSYASGSIGARHVASGGINTSGSVMPFSLASGTVNSGNVANAAVVSGSLASGNIGKYHVASGTGIVSAWVRFNASGGGAPVIESSLNISSVSRTGAGYYTVNVASGFADQKSMMVISAGKGGIRLGTDLGSSVNVTSGSFSFISYAPTTGVLTEPDIGCVVWIGLQA
jgi:hypothetical protein